jgi:hypothetical protein
MQILPSRETLPFWGVPICGVMSGCPRPGERRTLPGRIIINGWGKSKHPRVLVCACRQWQMTDTSPPPHVASRRRLDVLCSPVHSQYSYFDSISTGIWGVRRHAGMFNSSPSFSGAVTMERQGYASCSMLNGVITNRILPGTKREYSSSDFTCYGLHLDQDQETRNTSISLRHLDARSTEQEPRPRPRQDRRRFPRLLDAGR